MPYFTRDEYRLYYQTEGEFKNNQPVIFIHGYLGSSQSHWGDQLQNKQLSNEYFLIAPDLRGFANSGIGKKVEKHNTMDHILDIRILLTEVLQLKEKKPIFVGYSIGGTLALMYALKFTDVKAIVLVSPRPFLAKTTRAWNFLSKEKRSGKKKNIFIAILWKFVKRIQKFFTYISIKKGIRSAKDYLIQLSDLDIPILMLVGNKDTVNPQIAFDVLKKYLPSAKIIKFEGDHGITHEHPEEFNKILTTFLKQNS